MDENLAMVLNPDKWPIWPVLPMKRSGSEGMDLGFFFNPSIRDDSVKFFIGDIYNRIGAVEQAMTPEEVIDAGWRVD